MQQMQLDIDGAREPLACVHRHFERSINHAWCDRGGGMTYTDCGMPFCGGLAQCAYEPLDNSPEACARRVEWMREHGANGGDDA